MGLRPAGDRRKRRALRARAVAVSGRREQPGPRVGSGGRHAALRRAGRGGAPVGRRRERVRGLRRLLGRGPPRARAPVDRRGDPLGRRAGNELRSPDALRGTARRADPEHGAVDRAPPLHELGHRGGHERGQARAGVHRPVADRALRGLLPRPLRRAPHRVGLGGGDARTPRKRGRAGGRHRGYRRGSLQRPRRRR